MPIIHFYGPELTRDAKEEFVAEIARSASKATGLPEEKIITLFHVTDAESVGVGAELLANRK